MFVILSWCQDWSMSHVIAAINQDAPAQIYFLRCFFATRIYIYESERILLFRIVCDVFNYNFKNNNEKIFHIYKYFLSITRRSPRCSPCLIVNPRLRNTVLVWLLYWLTWPNAKSPFWYWPGSSGFSQARGVQESHKETKKMNYITMINYTSEYFYMYGIKNIQFFHLHWSISQEI